MEACGYETYIVNCLSGLDGDGVEAAATEVLRRLRQDGRELLAIHGEPVVSENSIRSL